MAARPARNGWRAMLGDEPCEPLENLRGSNVRRSWERRARLLSPKCRRGTEKWRRDMNRNLTKLNRAHLMVATLTIPMVALSCSSDDAGAPASADAGSGGS